MLKKIFKVVLYCIAFFFIIIVGLVIFVPVDPPESEEENIENVSSKTPPGFIKGNTYYHQPTEWQFKIPQGWQVEDVELAKKLYQAGEDFVPSSTGEIVQQPSQPSEELTFAHSPGNTLNFKYQAYDKKQFPQFEKMADDLYKTLSDSYQQSALQSGNEAAFERSKVFIGRNDFDNFHFTTLDPQTKNVISTNQTYVKEFNGNLAMITFSCTKEQICSTLEGAVVSSFFGILDPESRKIFHKAVEELERNNASETYRLISQAIEIEPNFAYYYIVRADAASRIEGYHDNFINDLAKAEELAPQLQDIYYLRATQAKEKGIADQYYFNVYKSNLFKQLQENNINLPRKTFGMTEREFQSEYGTIGYIQSGLTLDLVETLPLPRVGKKAAILFNKIEVVYENGAIKCSDNLPVDLEGVKITAYNLLTAFEDSSGQFYQLYYRVKYASK